MKNYFPNSFFKCIITVALLQLLSNHSYGQPPCLSETPFLLGPISTICAESGDPETISFLLSNQDGPGDYEITFPDGFILNLSGIANTQPIQHSMPFTCDNMPGAPTLPSPSDPYFEYLIEVKRTDCIDENGGFYTISPSLKVVPNPVRPFTYSNTSCIEYPFVVQFTGEVCDANLIEESKWYVDGVPRGDTLNLTYSFLNPGTYTVRFEVSVHDGCGPFYYEEDITITAAPSISANLIIDSTQLCQDIIEIEVNNNSSYVDSYSWSSTPSSNVSFSDPSGSNPTITIINDGANTYSLTLTGANAECDISSTTFEVTTFEEQSIIIEPAISTCIQAPITICDYYELIPELTSNDTVNWTSSSPANVVFSDQDILCPTVTFTSNGSFTLTLSGRDLCGNDFSFDMPATVYSAPIFDFLTIPPLCESNDPINLLDYVDPSVGIETCMLNGTTLIDCLFGPSGREGANIIQYIDTCGIAHEETILVTEAGVIPADMNVCVGDTIYLDDEVQPGLYSGNSVENNIFHSDVYGVFSINFEDTTSCGGSGQFEINVIEPIAGFAIQNTPCQDGTSLFPEGTEITVVNTSNADVLCYRILGPNQEFCNSNDVTLPPLPPDTYTIQQIVEAGPGCRDTTTQTVTIEPLYQPGIATSIDTTACDSVFISYSITPIVEGYQYYWTFSNGDTSTLANPSISVERPVSNFPFIAYLEVATPCDTINVPQLEQEIGARFQVSFDILNDNNRVCSGDTAFIQNTSSNYDSLSISFDGTSSAFVGHLVLSNNNDTIQYYEITVEGFKEGCPPITAIETLAVLPPDTEAAFSLDYETNFCSPFKVRLTNSSTPGANDTVNWGDGSSWQQIGSLEELEHIYHFTKDTIITITLISTLCGKDTAYRDITVLGAPEIGFEAFPAGGPCVNEKIHFETSGDIEETYDIDWDFGDGSPISHFPNPVHVYEIPDTYIAKLTVTDTNGCSSVFTSAMDIKAYSGVNLLLEAPRIVCISELFDLNIIQSEPNTWISYGNGRDSSEMIGVPYQQEGDYILTVTSIDPIGCSRDTSLLVTVVSPIEVEILPSDTSIEYGDKVHLDFIRKPYRDISAIQWEGDSIRYPDRQATSAAPTEDGPYILNIVDEYGCPARDSIFISIKKEYEGRIYHPNAFSPNGDGQNDWFYLFAKPNTVAEIKQFRVFNRTGNLVFQCVGDCPPPNTPNYGWDGFFIGKAMNPAVFAWFAEIEFLDGFTHIFKGDVHLMR